MPRLARPLRALLPFWIFLVLFKFGGAFHFTILAPLGEDVLPVQTVGFLLGASALLQLLFDVPVGRTLDRVGYIRGLTLGTAAFVLAGVSLVAGNSVVAFLLTLALSTVGWLLYGPGMSAYVLSQAPRAQSGQYVALRDVAGSIGVVLGMTFLALFVHVPPPIVGLVVSLLLLAALLALRSAPRDTAAAVHERTLVHHQLLRRHRLADLLGTIRRLNPASTILLLQEFGAGTLYSAVWFVVPLLIDADPSASVLGIGLSTFDLAVVALGFLIGRIVDHGSKRFLVLGGLGLFAVAGSVLGFHLTWWFIPLSFIATLGDELASVTLWSWVATLDKDHSEDAELSSAVMVFEDLGWALGPVLAGVALWRVGPGWTLLLAALPLALALLVALGSLLHPASRHLVRATRVATAHRWRHHHRG